MNNDPNNDKLAGGEIVRVPRPPKEHGKLYRFFDNFWYHYKWHTIIILFFLVVILFCTLQMCNRESGDGDISVIVAGPNRFTSEGEAYRNLAACLSLYLPEDYNGNGEKKAEVIAYSVFSQEQLEAISADEVVTTSANSQEYEAYHSYLTTGESSVLFLDPWLFEELAARPQYLTDISAYLGYTPAGAMTRTGADGERVCGVRLGDTALYRENSAVRDALSADTVVALAGPFFLGKSGKEAEYAKAVAYYGALVR